MEETLLAAMAAAVAGAIAGSMLTWWSQRQRDARDDGRALQAKLHQLEIRIVKLEAENRGFIVVGSRDLPRPEGNDA